MGWEFPYVSTYGSDFAFDFGLALTEEQADEMPEVKEMIENPPEWLEEWSGQIGARLKDGLRENPCWIAFARDDETIYHTYTVSAPDPFVAPYFGFLLVAYAEAPTLRAPLMAEGRIPGLTPDPSSARRAPHASTACSGPAHRRLRAQVASRVRAGLRSVLAAASRSILASPGI